MHATAFVCVFRFVHRSACARVVGQGLEFGDGAIDEIQTLGGHTRRDRGANVTHSVLNRRSLENTKPFFLGSD